MKFTVRNFGIMKSDRVVIKLSFIRRLWEKFFPVVREVLWHYDVKFWTKAPVRIGDCVMFDNGLKVIVHYSDRREQDFFVMAKTIQPTSSFYDNNSPSPNNGGLFATAFKESTTKN